MRKIILMITFVSALLALMACTASGDNLDVGGEEQTAVTAVPALQDVAEEMSEETAAANSDTGADAPANTDETEETAVGNHTGAEEPVITYEREGGLKGIGPNEYVWRIYADGRVTSSQEQTWQVTPQEVTALLTSINIANFRSLDTNYVPEDTCCDRALHTITIQTEGQTTKVTTLDAADMPETLTNALDSINTFLMDLQ